MTKEKIKLGWNFDNSYSRLPKSLFSALDPTPVKAPELVIFNSTLAKSLGLNENELQGEQGVAIFAGNRIPDGGFPIAQAYAGHQYGHFTMLGDGRALLLGEQITPDGDRVDIQLKGSGKTPYSRRGDGRAVLGPMLREYIISEAMHNLGIPTTRSLAVVKTGEDVYRENKKSGAILTRVASSHLRVGTFEYVAKWGTVEELKTLADYTLQRHFRNVAADENPYLGLLREVIKRQAVLIAKWQLVGFVHGVMNTDNMTISGETIDFGPCAFMDTYDPSTVFSSIDLYGRYAYENQPTIAVWNLTRFSETLLPLLHDNKQKAVKLARDEIIRFNELYRCNRLAGMRSKLGLFNQEDDDESLIEGLLKIMHKYKADYINTFIALTFNKLDNTPIFKTEEFIKWHKLWQARLKRQPQSKENSAKLMRNNNPAVIPRNHRVEEALEAAESQGDYSVMERLLDVLSDPYAHLEKQAEYSELPPPSDRPYRTFCGT